MRAPATRDQADAYRFGLRRLEAALVRGDAVPLHEQIRSQRRAAAAGVALGLLGLCGAALFAVIGPKPDWRQQAVVTTPGESTVYAVAGDPRQLVPVADVAAARLVLAATGRTDGATATPSELPARALEGAQRATIPVVTGADGARPEATIAPSWALCDVVGPDGAAVGTTVIGGAAAVPPADEGRGVLLAGPDDDTWLATGGRRFRVDVGDGGLLAAYGMTREVPRPVNPDLLEMLPEGPELRTPVVPGRGGAAPDGLPGRVGDVLVARGADGPEYHVVLRDGVQRVPEVAADLLRVASGARAPREVDPEALADARPRTALDVTDWPAVRPRLAQPSEAPVTCWTWSAAGEPTGQVWTGPALPLPPGAEPVALGQADGPGERVDAVWTGTGGAVRVDGGPVADDEPAGGRAGDRDGDRDGGAEDRDAREGGSADDRSDRRGTSSDEDAPEASGASEDPDDTGAPRSRTGTGTGTGTGGDAGPERTGSERSTGGPGGSADEESAGEIGTIALRPALDLVDPLSGAERVLLVAPNGVVHGVADEATATALGVVTAEPAPESVIELLPVGAPLDLAATTAAVQNLR